jgi:hypothetical protein
MLLFGAGLASSVTRTKGRLKVPRPPRFRRTGAVFLRGRQLAPPAAGAASADYLPLRRNGIGRLGSPSVGLPGGHRVVVTACQWEEPWRFWNQGFLDWG